jgi:hypothetical protein
MMSFQEAKAILLDLGYSLRRTGYGDEFRAAPLIGTSSEKEYRAYYSGDLADIVATIRYMRRLEQRGGLA